MARYTKKEIIRYTLSVIALLVFLYLISSIDNETLEKITTELGWWGMLFFVFIILCTYIFVPLSGTAFYFVGIKLYGYGTALILLYIVAIISSVISFYIARRWGRKIVRKLVGEKMMNHIDNVTESHENLLLITGRTLGFFFFDFISYALGLTKISFKKYFTYTVLLTLIPAGLQYLVFKSIDFHSFKGLMIYYVSIAFTGLIFAYIFARLMKLKKNN